jgi:hypothetical protein
MNMRGNTQTSGDGQLDLSHIEAGIACLAGLASLRPHPRSQCGRGLLEDAHE